MWREKSKYEKLWIIKYEMEIPEENGSTWLKSSFYFQPAACNSQGNQIWFHLLFSQTQILCQYFLCSFFLVLKWMETIKFHWNKTEWTDKWYKVNPPFCNIYHNNFPHPSNLILDAFTEGRTLNTSVLLRGFYFICRSTNIKLQSNL